ncbi:MAG: F0F1 ATP synthase subunit A [Bacillota bacterium]
MVLKRTRRKRILFIGLLLVFVAFVASGCGEGFDLHKTEAELNTWGFPMEPTTVNIAGYDVKLNLGTIYYTWIAMALTLLLCIAAARGCSVRTPSKLASLIEMIFDFLKGQLYDSMSEKKGRGLYPLILTYFIFILVCNLMGVVPTLVAPTGDINTTLGMALITFIMIYVWGLRYTGPKMFIHYLKPLPILPIIEDLAKPVTLAFRLFGNMKGKHIMMVSLLGLITGMTEYCGGFLASVIWLAFGIFVSAIQAFIFTVLSIAYISMVVSEEHH